MASCWACWFLLSQLAGKDTCWWPTGVHFDSSRTLSTAAPARVTLSPMLVRKTLVVHPPVHEYYSVPCRDFSSSFAFRLFGKLCKFQISNANIYFTFQRRQRRPAALHPSSSSHLTFVRVPYRGRLSLGDVWVSQDLLIVLQISRQQREKIYKKPSTPKESRRGDFQKCPYCSRSVYLSNSRCGWACGICLKEMKSKQSCRATISGMWVAQMPPQ